MHIFDFQKLLITNRFEFCREALYFVFDFVFHLEEALNVTRLNPEDYSKLYSLLALRSFENCAYLSPSMVAVKNCDDIFSKKTKEIVLLDGDDHAAVFLFKPSYYIFKSVTKCLADFNINGKILSIIIILLVIFMHIKLSKCFFALKEVDWEFI